MGRTHMTVARVVKLNTANVNKTERHNERKNTNYDNMNVDLERTKYNVSFKSPGSKTYLEYFDGLVASGEISTRGLKAGATVFDEMIIDVNTEYFEEHGGYEFAKRFYEEAYHFCRRMYGDKQIVSAVMHADEINTAATEKYGKPVYHYHLHVVAIPTVRKEVLWTKRCKDPALVGTVKEVITQVSHSKMWKSEPAIDERGKQVLVKSYSVLQDKLYDEMLEAGFTDIARGINGSKKEHLSTLDFQIRKEQERLIEKKDEVAQRDEILTEQSEQLTQQQDALAEIKQETEKAKEQLTEEKEKLEKFQKIAITAKGLSQLGHVGLLGNYSLTPQEYKKMMNLAKEGLASREKISVLTKQAEESRAEVSRLQKLVSSLQARIDSLKDELFNLRYRFDDLKRYVQPYLNAIERFPEAVHDFMQKLFPPEETQQTIKRSRNTGAR